jgi:penicillin amidase
MISVKKMLVNYPLLGRFVLFFVLPVSIFSLCIFLYLSRSLPVLAGEISSVGLQDQVKITRNNYSIPSILANTDNDAFFALGYVHVQDRLWQMEMNRRIISGRISEVIGIKGLGSDKYLRTLGLYNDTKAMWEKLEPETKVLIQSYVDGVNAAIKDYKVLPIEFLYFQLNPEPWTVYDTLAVVGSMSLLMSHNYQEELMRSTLIDVFGVAKSKDLFPNAAIDDVENLVSYMDLMKIQGVTNKSSPAIFDAFSQQNFLTGSNNWVVSGQLTNTGAPLLANDPHLGTTAPAIWYMASVKGEAVDVAGATIPGFPFVISGHNNKIAWGITNLEADVQDLRLEQTDANAKDTYIKDGINKKFVTRRELINIKADLFKKDIEPLAIDIRETENGPVISDIIGGPDGMVYSLSWVAKLGLSGTVDAFKKINYAHNWESFRSALRGYTVPAQNFVYADMEGNIGHIAAGLMPVRNGGYGALPVPGWSSEFDWKGWIPFDSLPQSFNPSSGIIVTANNKVVADDYAYYITSDWLPPYRANRIDALLKEKVASGNKLSVDDFRLIQGDTTSLAAQQLNPYFLRVHPTTATQQLMLDELKTWDGNLGSESVAASIFTAWVKNLNRLILEDEVDSRSLSPKQKMYLESLIDNVDYDFLFTVLNDDKNLWCDYKTTTAIESCDQIFSISLERAAQQLDRFAGGSVSSWNWKDIHKTQYVHFPFTKSDLSIGLPSTDNKFLHFLMHRELGAGGDENTVNVAPVIGENSNKKFLQFLGGTYRQVIDLKNLKASLFSIAPGQSGNVLSSHYDDLMEPHQNIALINIGEDAGESINVLTLMPR